LNAPPSAFQVVTVGVLSGLRHSKGAGYLGLNTGTQRKAHAHAKSIAKLAVRSLGKLLALTPTISDQARYGSEPSYNYQLEQMGEKKPLAYFAPAENEVVGFDAAELSQAHRIELRCEIE